MGYVLTFITYVTDEPTPAKQVVKPAVSKSTTPSKPVTQAKKAEESSEESDSDGTFCQIYSIHLYHKFRLF